MVGPVAAEWKGKKYEKIYQKFPRISEKGFWRSSTELKLCAKM